MLTYPDLATAAALAAGYSTPSQLASAVGISDVAARRRLHRLEALRVARRVSYRPLGGLGRKPTRYRLSPRAVFAVLDLRDDEKTLSYCSPPDYRFKKYLPKIYEFRPDADKDEILLNECLPALENAVKSGAFVALTVLAADGAPIIEARSAGVVYRLTLHDVDAWFLRDAPADDAVAVAHLDVGSLTVSVVKNGVVLYGESFSCGGFDVALLTEKLLAAAGEFGAHSAVIISDCIFKSEKDEVRRVFPDASFYDSSVYSPAEQAVRLTIHKILTGELIPNDKDTRR